MTAITSGSTNDLLQDYYGKRAVLAVWEADNAELLASTSPFAICAIHPRVRIDPQVLISGEVSGGTILTLGNFHGSINSRIEELKIFICPVTGNEFTEKQLESYRDSIRNKCDYEIGAIESDVDNMTITVTVIRPGKPEVKRTYKHLMMKVGK